MTDMLSSKGRKCQWKLEVMWASSQMIPLPQIPLRKCNNSSISPLESYRWTIFLKVTLNLHTYQGYAIFSGHKQSLCQILTYNNFPLQGMAYTGFMHFFNNDPELAQMTLGQNHDTPSAIFEWSGNFQCSSIIKIWTRHDCTDKQTERRIRWFLHTPSPPKNSFVCGGYDNGIKISW